MEEGGGLVSRLKWKVRSSVPVKVDSISIIEGRYLATSRSNSLRLFSLLRVGLSDEVEDSKLDYSAAVRITLQHQRVKGLLDGLHRTRIPFLYTMMVKPSGREEVEENQVFEFDLVVGTWVDSKAKELQEASAAVEQHAATLAAALSVGIPNSSVRRLTRGDLADFAAALLQPTEPKLRQVADSTTLSSLESFENHNPMVSPGQVAPDFYVPNAKEAGTEGITLGRVKTRSGTAHEFRLQIEDLRRHVTLMGMTGSGKSTTAAVIVRQVAGMGLPVMILDWHNEHAALVRSVGGQVLSPGKDDFALNPLDVGPAGEPGEHIETVTDIFSDTYHFTHPQAYMFRNALQRCFSESSEMEVTTLASLVSTVESYPLRSAYDNETKVALLRRLVPLTEGHVGRAFNSPSSHTVDELLDKVLCVELGHIRDIQSRSIFADILMKLIYETRLARKSRMEHLIMIEEARNIAPARRAEDPPSVGERMISELRKFGESMLFVAQFPSQVASEVIKNSGVRIFHRVSWAEDMKLIRDSLNMTPEQLSYISGLGVGEAVVSLARLQKPVLVQVDAGAALSERRDVSLVGEP
jgi:hypothetical protein